MEKEFFIDRLSDAIELAKDCNLIFAQPTHRPARKPATLVAFSRIIVPLDGDMPLTYSDGSQAVSALIEPGSVIYARPYGWSNPGWDVPHEFLSLVFNSDFLRFVHVRHDGSPALSEGPNRGKSYYHTSIAPSRPISLLAGVMNYYAEEAATDRILAVDCLLLMMREAMMQLIADQPVSNGKPHALWQNIRSDMRENFHHAINRETIAKKFKLNPSYVSRLFASHGENFNAYLQSLRMSHALHLLDTTQDAVKEIAYHSGFNSASYFIKVFSDSFGMTPWAFRNRFRK